MKKDNLTRLVVTRGPNEFALPPVWQKKPKPKLPPFRDIIAGMSVPQLQRLHARLSGRLAKMKAAQK
jgi:hypothetical protein